ncbi:Crp/Fnr family transcriptional regulator [Corticibacter populi]|nr:Crp/Fnr family transcriptional regulator [Corticibacter populi]RZS35344.1 CRP-like cAMP-binding protein [Corticibacter populi]
MSNTSLTVALSRSPTFSKASQQLLTALAHSATPVQLYAQQHLFIAGDEARYFYWLESGTLTLYSPSLMGESKVFRSLEAGALVAETVMYAQPCHYPLSAVAEQDCRLQRLPRELLLSLTRQSADFAYSLVEILSSRILQAVNRIDLLTITNSAQRLVSYLMDVHAQQGTAWLQLNNSHNVIARQLNITPETFSRHLAQFRRRGLIGTGRQRELVLLDPVALCHEVGLPPPNLHFIRTRPASNLSGSLFECCNLL